MIGRDAVTRTRVDKPPWYRRWAERLPRREISGRDDLTTPYMVRYTVFQSRLLTIYLHQILRSDDTQDFHDHPWAFFHVILEGGYIEETPGGTGVVLRKPRVPGFRALRRPLYQHRLQLFNTIDLDGHAGDRDLEAWTLVVIGPRVRKWGFIDRVSGCWTHWQAYLAGDRCAG